MVSRDEKNQHFPRGEGDFCSALCCEGKRASSLEKPHVSSELLTTTLILHSNLHRVLMSSPEAALDSVSYLSQPEQKLPHATERGQTVILFMSQYLDTERN